MSATVNVHEAKTHLSKLLRRVMQGERIVIASANEIFLSADPTLSRYGVEILW
ncbi:MAG: type II toxin-antitoxin system Phd/YefM family antitoxin [Candidatus Promineifilaceae bacterium]